MVTTFICDGVIISTSSGSTSFSYTAGGPLIHQNVACILISPICPHSLSFRNLMFPKSVTLKLKVTIILIKYS